MKRPERPGTLASLILIALGAGCGVETTSPSQGTLSLEITDAPVDNAARVVVEFTGVSLKPSQGEALSFDFDAPRQIDLLALQGGETRMLLDKVVLDAGRYEWIRLSVNAGRNASDSFIELEDGSMHPLFIPSGNETGLKLIRGFTILANAAADFTIDFDLRKSVVEPSPASPEYILKPALRLVDNAEVGAITGSVDPALANTAACSPAVYVYESLDAQADDVGSANEPVASSLVQMNDSNGQFEYAVAFLASGNYTVALTCEADDDAADSDDDITFEAQRNAAVETGHDTTVDF